MIQFCVRVCVRAKSIQSCPALCDPTVCNHQAPPSGGISQATPSSRGSSWPRDWTRVSYVSCTSRWVLYRYCYLGIYIYIPFQILFPYGLLHNIGLSPLCYTVGLCWLSILYIVAYMLIPNSYFIPPPLTPLGTRSLFSLLWFCLWFVNKFICVIFPDFTYKWYQVVFAFLCLDYIT